DQHLQQPDLGDPAHHIWVRGAALRVLSDRLQRPGQRGGVLARVALDGVVDHRHSAPPPPDMRGSVSCRRTVASSIASDPRIVAGMRTQLAERRAEIDAGARPLGWKLGMGGAAALAALQTTGALVGYLIADNVLADGAQVTVGAWGDPRFE